VIEFWLENRLMVEVLTVSMQQRYLENISIDGFKAMLAEGPDIEHATLSAPVAPRSCRLDGVASRPRREARGPRRRR
jgi:hypothetical protein